MLNIGICDDNKSYRQQLHKICDSFVRERKIEATILEYSSAEDKISQNTKDDLLFLDVEMNGMSGIQYKEYLWKENSDTKIIFVTSHDENMEDGFGDNVQGYLLKPISVEKTVRALERFYSKWSMDTIIVSNGSTVKNINISDILYIQAEGNYVSFVTNKGNVLGNNGISYWEEKLSNYPFFRAQRSFLVNLAKIKKTGKVITMENDDSISCSREKISEIKEARMNYLKNEGRRFSV